MTIIPFALLIILAYHLIFVFTINAQHSEHNVINEFNQELETEQPLTTESITKSTNSVVRPSHSPVFQLPLDSKNKYRLFWTLDYEASLVNIEVRAKLNTLNDWFAIGFSDYGNITGADLCVLWFDKKPRAYFEVSFGRNKLGLIGI